MIRFCGTGGILIEGADMGLKVTGIDLKEKMIEFSKGNLKHYGFKGNLKNSDFEEISTLDLDRLFAIHHMELLQQAVVKV